MWDLVVDEKFEYHFTVETNFYTKELNKKKEAPKETKRLLIDDIVTDSFFHDLYGKTLKESIVYEQKTLLVDKPKELSKIILDKLENIKSSQNETKEKLLTIEKDMVNRHPCMETVLEILEFLFKNFPGNNPDLLPAYLQHILYELKNEETNTNIKIFFIKIMINSPHIFERHFKHFIPILIKFSLEKNIGGKGFHYFLRDIATLIIITNFQLDLNKENADLCSNYINALIKLSGDQKNFIFKTNLSI